MGFNSGFKGLKQTTSISYCAFRQNCPNHQQSNPRNNATL